MLKRLLQLPAQVIRTSSRERYAIAIIVSCALGLCAFDILDAHSPFQPYIGYLLVCCFFGMFPEGFRNGKRQDSPRTQLMLSLFLTGCLVPQILNLSLGAIRGAL